MEEVYCFPRLLQIFSFGRRVIYHSKCLWDYILKSIPSVCLCVCTTIFKRIAGLHFYPESLMLYINGFDLQASTNKRKDFFRNFEFVLEFFAETQKIFNRIARRGYWSNCIAMCYISIDLSQRAPQTYEKLFLKFRISFRNFGWKQNNVQTNSKA